MTSIGKTCCNKKYKQVSEMIVVEESCRIQLSYRVLGVKSTTHSHPMAENPFEYSEHLCFNSPVRVTSEINLQVWNLEG